MILGGLRISLIRKFFGLLGRLRVGIEENKILESLFKGFEKLYRVMTSFCYVLLSFSDFSICLVLELIKAF